MKLYSFHIGLIGLILASSTVVEAQVQIHPFPEMVDPFPGVGASAYSDDGKYWGVVAPGVAADSFQLGIWSRFGGFQAVGSEMAGPWDYGLNDARVVAVLDEGKQAVIFNNDAPVFPGFTQPSLHWEAGVGVTPYGTFPGSNGWDQVEHVSADGRLAYGFTNQGDGVRWVDVTTADFICNVIPGAPCNLLVVDLTPDGSAFVARTTFSNFLFHYREGSGLTQIYQGGSFSPELARISDDGTKVVYYSTTLPGTSTREIRRWHETGGEDVLGTFVTRGLFVNVDGSEVVWGDGMIWTEASGAWTQFKDRMIQQGAWLFQNPGVSSLSISWMAPDFGSAKLRYFQGSSQVHAFATFANGDSGTLGDHFCGAANINSSGLPSGVWALGSEVVVDNDLRFVASNLLSGQFAMAINSRGQDFVTYAGGSFGSLCLGGGSGIGRHNRPGEIGTVDATGQAEITIDVNNLATPFGGVAAQVGETWHFQVWYRDVFSGTPVSNFTEAISITFE